MLTYITLWTWQFISCWPNECITASFNIHFKNWMLCKSPVVTGIRQEVLNFTYSYVPNWNLETTLTHLIAWSSAEELGKSKNERIVREWLDFGCLKINEKPWIFMLRHSDHLNSFFILLFNNVTVITEMLNIMFMFFPDHCYYRSLVSIQRLINFS